MSELGEQVGKLMT